jgi:hypothetical protein
LLSIAADRTECGADIPDVAADELIAAAGVSQEACAGVDPAARLVLQSLAEHGLAAAELLVLPERLLAGPAAHGWAGKRTLPAGEPRGPTDAAAAEHARGRAAALNLRERVAIAD